MRDTILKPVFERQDNRGLFQELLSSGTWESLIYMRMNPDAVIGNHYHKKTEIFLYLLSGSAEIKTVHVESGERDRIVMLAGNGIALQPYYSHAIRFTSESEAIMLKSRRYEEADPDTYSFPVES
jgi:dTDP-4-dehydrorhamnose 3,5-epimerase-like enzyme